MRSLLKQINYCVFSVTSVSEGKLNANIVTWVMQSAMKGKRLVIALDKEDLTIQQVKASGIFNLNILSEEQTKLINKLGRKSGRDSEKLKNIDYFCDDRDCPVLSEAIGYIQCKVLDCMDSLDHEVFVCEVLKQKALKQTLKEGKENNKDRTPMTINFLREKKLIRG